MAASGTGYYEVASDGGIFAFDAPFQGSMGGKPLNAPIVSMAATPDRKGYWLVGADGVISALGDAGYYGSMGGTVLNQPVVGMAATPDGKGTGGSRRGNLQLWVTPRSTARWAERCSTQPVVGMAATPDGKGYWLVGADGGIFSFGDAPFYGSTGGQFISGPPSPSPPTNPPADITKPAKTVRCTSSTCLSGDRWLASPSTSRSSEWRWRAPADDGPTR